MPIVTSLSQFFFTLNDHSLTNSCECGNLLQYHAGCEGVQANVCPACGSYVKQTELIPSAECFSLHLEGGVGECCAKYRRKAWIEEVAKALSSIVGE